MRKRFGQALRIGVSDKGLALAATSRWRGAPFTVLAEHVFPEPSSRHDGAAIALGLRSVLADAGCEGWPATVVLADELSRIWQVVPPLGAARLADLEAAAALRFQTLYGESASTWKLAAGWDAGQPFLAAAMPLPLLAAIEQGAQAHQLAIVEIVPQFIAGCKQWRSAIKPGAWYGLVQGGVLTLGAVDGRRICAVRAGALPPDAGPDWLDQHVAREALLLNLPMPERLQLSGQVPAGWSGGGTIACSVLGGPSAPDWSDAVRLAATGSRV